MSYAVTIVNPNPGGITVTLNGSALPAIEGATGGTSFHSLAAEFTAQNTVVVWYGMDRTFRYQLDVPGENGGLQLFPFLGVLVLIDLGIGSVVAVVHGTRVDS